MAGGLFSMEHPWASVFGILGTLLPVLCCAPGMLDFVLTVRYDLHARQHDDMRHA
jgi:hypothetical protein